MKTSTVRVLVVDDYQPWRRYVSSEIQKRPGLQVVGEASDGLEAVKKAEELQPDVILLDIGLPYLNGMEAARRVRKLSPMSKILFLSQNYSLDLAAEALSTGASGYIVKSNAASDLLPAVEAALLGNQFVSARLAGYASEKVAVECFPETTRQHEVAFFADDASFLDGLTHFLETALSAGNAAIVAATESHRNSLLTRLQTRGLDIRAALKEGRYISLDPADMCSAFMVNDLPDPDRFFRVAGDLIRGAANAAKGDLPRVAACGECSAFLWAQGKADAAIQLEHLWDRIARTYEVDIWCGYVLTDFQREPDSSVLQSICAEHSTVHLR
jgi:DNA-binding NarL/FixJ family response regulator